MKFVLDFTPHRPLLRAEQEELTRRVNQTIQDYLVSIGAPREAFDNVTFKDYRPKTH